jgi:hypothetical protein
MAVLTVTLIAVKQQWLFVIYTDSCTATLALLAVTLTVVEQQ